MISADRWRENWRAVASDGAVRVELTRSRAKQRNCLATVRALEAGSAVVFSASAPRAAARCRAFASSAGIGIEREYLAFPRAAAPAYLVEDAPAPVRHFAASVLVAPPRTRLSMPIELGLDLLCFLSPWRLVRALAPGRVVVGRRA